MEGSTNNHSNLNEMSTALISLGNNHLNDLPRTLYVGNLDPQVSDELIAALFGSLGKVTNVKIIHEPGNDPYCFVEFAEHSAASNALLTMNKRLCLGKELKVNWATSPGASGPKQGTSKKGQKDWDAILKELDDDDDKKEDSADDLFKKIYANGNDEVRRAMIKSFTESCGTVLSTNWAQVSKGTTEIKPPEGCELKKWT